MTRATEEYPHIDGHGAPGAVAKPAAAPDLVEVPDIGGLIDPDPLLKKADLKPKGIAIHGPIESDAAGIGEAYRQDPAAGTLVPKGSTVTYHFWWESQ